MSNRQGLRKNRMIDHIIFTIRIKLFEFKIFKKKNYKIINNCLFINYNLLIIEFV